MEAVIPNTYKQGKSIRRADPAKAAGLSSEQTPPITRKKSRQLDPLAGMHGFGSDSARIK